MSVNLTTESSQKHAVELKSGTVTLPVLKVMSTSLEAVAAQLAQKIRQAPDFFKDAPLIIDLHEIGSAMSPDSLAALVDGVRQEQLVPIGIRGGNPEQNAAAGRLQLAILPDAHAETKTAAPQRSGTGNASSTSASRLISQPIRSGQRIYSPGDLIVMSQVSAGAEIMADGNIHVYGSLRGRALAGVKGDLECRIFCRDLQAELVSISGHYRISENIDESLRGVPVQVYLDGDALIIERL